jgi:hypothetical protein
MEAFSLMVNWVQREANSSPIASAGIKNVWSYNIIPLYILMVHSLMKQIGCFKYSVDVGNFVLTK